MRLARLPLKPPIPKLGDDRRLIKSGLSIRLHGGVPATGSAETGELLPVAKPFGKGNVANRAHELASLPCLPRMSLHLHQGQQPLNLGRQYGPVYMY